VCLAYLKVESCLNPEIQSVRIRKPMRELINSGKFLYFPCFLKLFAGNLDAMRIWWICFFSGREDSNSVFHKCTYISPSSIAFYSFLIVWHSQLFCEATPFFCKSRRSADYFYGLNFLMPALDTVVAWDGHTMFTW